MLGRHLLGYLPVQAAQALVGFGGVAVLTRLMSPEMYGQYALAITAMHLVSMALFTWLDAAVARFHARAAARSALPAHLATAYRTFFLLVAAVVIIGAGLLLVLPIPADLKTTFGFALAALSIQSLLQIGQETRRAAGAVAAFSAIGTLNLLLGFALGIALLMATPLGAAGPIAGMALGAAIALVFDLPGQRKRASGGKSNARRLALYFAYGLPISISLVFEQLLSAGDRFLIAGFLGQAAVGVYAAGYGLADRSLDIIFVWMGAAATPLMVAALERGGPEAARKVAARTARIMALIGFPAAAGLALVAEPLAGVMVGEAFRPGAVLILPWIALAGLMKGVMTYYFHESFILGRRTRAMAAIMGGAALFNLALNAVLLPIFGIAGAAAATVIAYAASLLACAWIGRRIFALPLPWLDWGKTALATAGMAAAVLALPDVGNSLADLLLSMGAGIAVFAALALALNAGGCRGWVGEARARFAPAGIPS
ncbi:MAG TPA: polysaccharide biosynthesis protein [Alphaproteobacteria bacterium]|nr:polysaccharide biosynthesis protein [Alphaproteobacteria bacterium]